MASLKCAKHYYVTRRCDILVSAWESDSGWRNADLRQASQLHIPTTWYVESKFLFFPYLWLGRLARRRSEWANRESTAGWTWSTSFVASVVAVAVLLFNLIIPEKLRLVFTPAHYVLIGVRAQSSFFQYLNLKPLTMKSICRETWCVGVSSYIMYK